MGAPATAIRAARSTAPGRVFMGDGRHEAPLYRRELLRAGDTLTGPAVIQEFGSTLPIHPGFTATVDELGNVVVRR